MDLLVLLAPPGTGRAVASVTAGLALALLLALAFAVASVLTLFYGAIPGQPAGRTEHVPAAAPADPSAPPGPVSADVVAVAWQFLGTPYAWGGSSPATGFDCSGLVQWSYRQVGVALPRTAQQQYDATARVPTADLRPGDLVFFAATYPSPELITHVGIYVGGGQMINAPVEGKPIAVMPVFTDFWGQHFACGGRPVGRS